MPKLIDSPTFKHAMVNLGVSKEDLKKRVPEDFTDAEAN